MGDHSDSLANTISSLLLSLSPREREVLVERMVREPPLTLQVLGERFGVTRERVRQIEKKAQNRIESWLSPDGALISFADQMCQMIGRMRSLPEILTEAPELDVVVEGVGMPAWHVLDKLDPRFESDGRWIVDGSIADAKKEFHDVLRGISSPAGVLDTNEVDEAFQTWAPTTSASEVGDWMRELGYSHWRRCWIAPRIKSIPDRAVAYLSIVGEPRTDLQIQLDMIPNRALNAIKNALATDPRIARVDRASWSLRSWGLPEYAGLRKEIEKRLRAAGSISVSDLVDELTSLFSVSPKSVSAYASSWPFETSKGVVMWARKHEASRRSITQTRHVYRVHNGVALRLRINSDHMRGSGSSFPVAAADALALSPSVSVVLKGVSQSLTMSWKGTQPAIGSIRATLEQLGATNGDEVLLLITPPVFSAELLTASAGGLFRALVGESPTTDAIAFALAIEPGATINQITATLEDRDETDSVEDLLQFL